MAKTPDNTPQLVKLGNFPKVVHGSFGFMTRYIEEFESTRDHIRPTIKEWQTYKPPSHSKNAKIIGYWPITSMDYVIAPAIATLKHIRAKGPILELGCGNGLTAVLLSQELNTSVWGMDVCNQVIDEFHATIPRLPQGSSLQQAADRVHLTHANMYPPRFSLQYSHEATTQWIKNLGELEGKRARPMQYGRQGFPKFDDFGIIYHFGYASMKPDVLRLVAQYARNGALFWLAGTGISNIDVTDRYSQDPERIQQAERDKQRIMHLLERPSFPIKLISDQVDGNLFQVIR